MEIQATTDSEAMQAGPSYAAQGRFQDTQNPLQINTTVDHEILEWKLDKNVDISEIKFQGECAKILDPAEVEALAGLPHVLENNVSIIF